MHGYTEKNGSKYLFVGQAILFYWLYVNSLCPYNPIQFRNI